MLRQHRGRSEERTGRDCHEVGGKQKTRVVEAEGLLRGNSIRPFAGKGAQVSPVGSVEI